MTKRQTCFIFEYLPTTLAAEPRNLFLGPESNVCMGEDVLLVLPPGPSHIINDIHKCPRNRNNFF